MISVQDNNVTFTFYRPHARSVHLVGDFNGWREAELAMQPTEAGHWRARLRLPPGTFKFRYRADGEWFADYAAFGIRYGPHGADGIVHVPAAAIR